MAGAVVAVVGFGVAFAGLAVGSPALGQAPRQRPVIVDVGGDPANGFDIRYADGSSLSPPTDSESRVECSEYDTKVARVRCRVEVTTWYRDLGDLQRSLAYVRRTG